MFLISQTRSTAQAVHAKAENQEIVLKYLVADDRHWRSKNAAFSGGCHNTNEIFKFVAPDHAGINPLRVVDDVPQMMEFKAEIIAPFTTGN